MVKEYWKDIVGYEGIYEISNNGNIRSTKKGRLRKQEKTRLGYMRITLHKNGEPKRFQSHRLVATAFITNHENKPEVNHLDGVKHNNHISNLEWCTVSENKKHAFKVLGVVAHNPMKNKFGSDHNRSKEIKQLTKTGEFVKAYGSAGEAERQTGISRKNISQCIAGNNNTAGGFKWALQ